MGLPVKEPHGYRCWVTDQVPDQRALLDSVGVLGDESRWRLFSFVRRARRAVTREEAAQTVGMSRTLAAFHLDKMVAAGVLRSRYAGAGDVPKVGRRPKVYEPVEGDIAVSIPGRQYQLLADLLLDGLLAAGDGGTGRETVLRTAHERGRHEGASCAVPGPEGIEACSAMLAAQGYEPVVRDGAGIRLHNCPFHPLASRAPELVCGMNQAYVAGLIEGLRLDGVEAVLDPAPGACCVRIDASA